MPRGERILGLVLISEFSVKEIPDFPAKGINLQAADAIKNPSVQVITALPIFPEPM